MLNVTTSPATAHPQAACRAKDPTLWDIDHESHLNLFSRCRKCVAALAVCRRCPVRQRCADEAAATDDVYTIRGGWPMVPPVSGRTDLPAVPAPGCPVCGLPVLRGVRSRYCSTMCGRHGAAHARRQTAA
jgi:hypothetical protein